MKDTSPHTAAEINQRYSKSANVCARNLFVNVGDRHTFSDFKVIHAAISHEVFQGHGLDFEGWVRAACGQCSPALQRKCSTVTVEGVEDRHYREWVVDYFDTLPTISSVALPTTPDQEKLANNKV